MSRASLISECLFYVSWASHRTSFFPMKTFPFFHSLILNALEMRLRFLCLHNRDRMSKRKRESKSFKTFVKWMSHFKSNFNLNFAVVNISFERFSHITCVERLELSQKAIKNGFKWYLATTILSLSSLNFLKSIKNSILTTSDINVK